MDGQHFDELTRVLATPGTRRTLLKSLAGAVLGGLFGLPAATGEAAACRLIGQTCNANRRCCPGAACVRGRCRCKTGQNFFPCNGPGTRCVNIATSETHCGGCGNPPCGPSEICRLGGCVDHCEDGLHNANESDIDCGGSCEPCALGQRCATGADCDSAICDPVTDRCVSCGDGQLNGAETDVDCGGPDCLPCLNGMSCILNSDCQSGICDADDRCAAPHSCTDGVANGRETDTDCGGPDCPPCAAGKHCLADGDCQSGVCGSDLTCEGSCGEGEMFCGTACCPLDGHMCCDGVCTPILSDASNCGLCGRRCPQGTHCCDGGCFDLGTSTHHCGSCGNSCHDRANRVDDFCIGCCNGACSSFSDPACPPGICCVCP